MSKYSYCATLAGLILFPAWALGQTTFATLTGTVTDSTGAVIAGTTVTATHVETNFQSSVTANEQGIYTLAQLR